MKVNCIIIDDEPLAINVIKNYIDNIKGLNLVATFNNPANSYELLQSKPIDLIFLDINMPLLDGLSFVKSLNDPPKIIITTAHTEYALQSYELDVIDYLVKPIPFNRFVKATNKIFNLIGLEQRNTAANSRPYFFAKVEKKKVKIYHDEILYIESLKDYIKIITLSEKYIIHQTLSSITSLLPENKFVRIHRSYTISIDKVRSIEGNRINVSGTSLTIGRSYINEVKEIILQDRNLQ